MKRIIFILANLLLSFSLAWADDDAFEKLLARAQKGDINAQYEVGQEYLQQQRLSDAVEMWRLAAGAGNAAAQRELGLLYQAGAGVPKNSLRAVELLSMAAAQNDALAMFNLGFMYLDGEGVSQNLAKTEELWLGAAALGCEPAAYSLGGFYINGYNGAVNAAKAVEWYEKAYALGSFAAAYELGVMYTNGLGVPQDLALGLAWLEKAAARGSVEAKYVLGVMYYNGGNVERDYAKALAYFTELEEYGYPDCMYFLGVMYSRGLGTNKNQVKAVSCYENAALQNHGPAQMELGGMCFTGEGFAAKDAGKAYMWLCLAVENGVEHAAALRDDIARDMDFAQMGTAQMQLARAYFFGYGGSQNYVQAYARLLIAKSYGQNVEEMLATLRALTPEQRLEAEAFAEKWLAKHR